MNTRALRITDLSPGALGKTWDHYVHPSHSHAAEISPPAATVVPAPEPVFTNTRRELTDDGLCVLTFDRPDSAANIFDSTTLDELDAHLTFIAAHSELKGLVLLSAKPAIFIAGADVHTLYNLIRTPAPDLRDHLALMIERGQNLFDRLAALPLPTVAAIHRSKSTRLNSSHG